MRYCVQFSLTRSLSLSQALIGILFAVFCIEERYYSRVSVSLYVLMGWSGAGLGWPMVVEIPAGALVFLALGGLTYTAGVPFFAYDYKNPWFHTLFHVLILAGAVLMFVSVGGYVIV